MEKTTEWFGEWFNSPYYHILYKHRDFEEAQAFIDVLSRYFEFSSEDHILDLACGKGRHSIYLNQKGLRVSGIDLSDQNIAYASKYSNNRLHFEVHDMRLPFHPDTFTHVLNLFTSFGYFDTDEEHQQAIKRVAESLHPGGYFLLDFLNPYVVINQLQPSEKKEVEGIHFLIHKRFEEGYIIKDIRFEADQKSHHYFERVKAIRRWDFERYFQQAGLSLSGTFGDYLLNPYEAESSDRMIFIAKKESHGS
ncbi:MAG TPA: SAM-dependent methyltransferase [Cytophagales bacterium]|nr:SAM-dependent methyltransferase [Cytophagales bacterium]HAA20914.1 SAM-dependent methyltransferase [Cytophagales bacterium]HAP60598.1 SAM-dependent methyltransferase [Cytophagales bacterium]